MAHVPGYFEVVGLTLKQGRTFERRDNVRGAPPVAVVLIDPVRALRA